MTRILFFGVLREKAGGAERNVDVPRGLATMDALIEWLAASDAELKSALLAPSVRIAVDQSILSGRNEPFGAADEIAFLPPFSGG